MRRRRRRSRTRRRRGRWCRTWSGGGGFSCRAGCPRRCCHSLAQSQVRSRQGYGVTVGICARQNHCVRIDRDRLSTRTKNLVYIIIDDGLAVQAAEVKCRSGLNCCARRAKHVPKGQDLSALTCNNRGCERGRSRATGRRASTGDRTAYITCRPRQIQPARNAAANYTLLGSLSNILADVCKRNISNTLDCTCYANVCQRPLCCLGRKFFADSFCKIA